MTLVSNARFLSVRRGSLPGVLWSISLAGPLSLNFQNENILQEFQILKITFHFKETLVHNLDCIMTIAN